jgi:hypothetical protein
LKSVAIVLLNHDDPPPARSQKKKPHFRVISFPINHNKGPRCFPRKLKRKLNNTLLENSSLPMKNQKRNRTISLPPFRTRAYTHRHTSQSKKAYPDGSLTLKTLHELDSLLHGISDEDGAGNIEYHLWRCIPLFRLGHGQLGRIDKGRPRWARPWLLLLLLLRRRRRHTVLYRRERTLDFGI